MGKKSIRHLLFPALLPLIFAVVAATPVETLGCRLRGMLAALLALTGAILGLVSASKGLFERIRNRPGSGWWMATALVLALPAIYIVLITN